MKHIKHIHAVPEDRKEGPIRRIGQRREVAPDEEERDDVLLPSDGVQRLRVGEGGTEGGRRGIGRGKEEEEGGGAAVRCEVVDEDEVVRVYVDTFPEVARLEGAPVLLGDDAGVVLERAVLEVGAAAESARQRDLEVALTGVSRCGRVRVRVVLYRDVNHHIEDGMGFRTYQTAGDGGRSTADDGLPDVEENAGSAVLVKGASVAMLGAGIHIIGVK